MFILIENVRLYNPQDQGVQNILICNDKIVAIGGDFEGKLADLSVRKIDGHGLLAVPGYLDQHVHPIGGGGEGSFKTRVPELQLSACIRAGVTTLVGLLGTDGITRSMESLVAKTKGLNEEGITAFCLTGSYGYPPITLTGNVQKDIAFIQEIIGLKIAISDHRSPHLTKEELIRLASDVRVASLISGKSGIIVLHLGTGKKQLEMIFKILQETDLPISLFRPTHVQKVMEQAIKFAKLGGYIDFTADPDSDQLVEDIIKALEQGVSLELITISSDANGSAPRWNEKNEMIGIKAAAIDSLHSFIVKLTKTKQFSLPQALSLVTTNPARALGLDKMKGRLEPGYDADLLLLDESLAIDTVIAKGQILLADKKLKVTGTFE